MIAQNKEKFVIPKQEPGFSVYCFRVRAKRKMERKRKDQRTSKEHQRTSNKFSLYRSLSLVLNTALGSFTQIWVLSHTSENLYQYISHSSKYAGGENSILIRLKLRWGLLTTSKSKGKSENKFCLLFIFDLFHFRFCFRSVWMGP